MTTRIEVDDTLCAGLGICESQAPDYFKVGDDDRSTPLRTTVEERDMEQVAAAVECCPMLALRLT